MCSQLTDIMADLRSANLSYMRRKDYEKRGGNNKPNKSIMADLNQINGQFKITNTWDDVIKYFMFDKPIFLGDINEGDNSSDGSEINLESYYSKLLSLWEKYNTIKGSQYEPTTKTFTIRTNAKTEDKDHKYTWESTGDNGKIDLSIFKASVNELETILGIKVLYSSEHKRYYYIETKVETESYIRAIMDPE